jgi:hypothetical protein
MWSPALGVPSGGLKFRSEEKIPAVTVVLLLYGGKLNVPSSTNGGTEVNLRFPGRRACDSTVRSIDEFSTLGASFWFSRTFGGDEVDTAKVRKDRGTRAQAISHWVKCDLSGRRVNLIRSPPVLDSVEEPCPP